jgi:hypothetical protein
MQISNTDQLIIEEETNREKDCLTEQYLRKKVIQQRIATYLKLINIEA